MKTKELIQQLQEADPSGELEVSCGLIDIIHVDRAPSYYDGYQQVLIRDPSRDPYYNIVGGKYNGKNDKVVICPLTISDAIWNHRDKEPFVVDYSELPEYRGKMLQKAHEYDADNCERAHQENEFEHFFRWIKPKLEELPPEDVRDLKHVAHTMFEILGIHHSDPLPNIPEGSKNIGSYIDRRIKQWEEKYEVVWDMEPSIRERNKSEPDK